MSASYCTSCGSPRGTTAYCTSCGARHQDRSPAAAASAAEGVVRPAPLPRGLRCVQCGSAIDSGLVCARCASQASPAQPAAASSATPKAPAQPAPIPPRPPSDSTPSPSGAGHRWVATAAAWALVALVGVVWWNSKTHGGFGRDASATAERLSGVVANGGLDGTYACADGATTMTVTIRGSVGDMDLGVASARGMRVERHGDTVSMSGGQYYDAQGQPVDAQTRAAMGGGDDVDLLTVGDDGQSLSLALGEGRRAKFVKQP